MTDERNDIGSTPTDSAGAGQALPPTAGTAHASTQPAAPDPFDPARFATRQTVAGEPGITRHLATCPVRKPHKQEFFRLHPGAEYQLKAHILELKLEGETYLVLPEVAAAVPGETQLVTLRLAVSRQGSVFLWAVREPSLDGRQDSWGQSRQAAVALAETKWVRMTPQMAAQAYDVVSADGVLQEPTWPDKPMRDLLALAFGDRFIIQDAHHPVLQRLLGLG